jgi:hypothetical protein
VRQTHIQYFKNVNYLQSFFLKVDGVGSRKLAEKKALVYQKSSKKKVAGP